MYACRMVNIHKKGRSAPQKHVPSISEISNDLRVRLDRFIYKTLLTKTFLRGNDDEVVTTTEPPTNDN